MSRAALDAAVRLLAALPAHLQPHGALQVMRADAAFEPNPTVPTLVVGAGNSPLPEALLAALRLSLRADQPVWVFHTTGLPSATTLDAVRSERAAGLFVPAVEPEAAERSLAGLRQIVHRLRAPGGCPWDRKQTHESLARYAIEEAYEVVDAIRHEGKAELAEELGDLLLQVFLQAELAQETGDFTLNDVVEQITTKLIRRHPHVFGDVTVGGASDVEVNWEKLKQAEKTERTSALDGVPQSLPALMAALEVQKRLIKAGFDWPDRRGPEDKLDEEIAELRAAESPEEVQAELGDVLFILTRLGLDRGANAEDGLRETVRKVDARYRYVEAKLREREQAPTDVAIDELLALWREAKGAAAARGQAHTITAEPPTGERSSPS
ncbi:MAG: nucleoside triphosphate pyrophosphohydrolase [Chloroflexi bacterium]|nr:nucleoside triphosphate pyrophosphohydrolase [Chloroflexota bacterium]